MKRKSKQDTLDTFSQDVIEMYGHPKISRKQAVAGGLTFYWTGKPCIAGHLTYRYTSSMECRTCKLIKHGKQYEDGKPKDVKVRSDRLKRDMEFNNIGKDYYDFDLDS
ncbi:hypothetical protein D3C85_580890 [compost metagenome]